MSFLTYAYACDLVNIINLSINSERFLCWFFFFFFLDSDSNSKSTGNRGENRQDYIKLKPFAQQRKESKRQPI